MIDELRALEHEALNRLAAVESSEDLAQWQADYLGRHGALTGLLRALGSLPVADRPAAGREANDVKRRLQAAAGVRRASVRPAAGAPPLDITLPGRHPAAGQLHPITAIVRRMRAAFAQMGFQVYVSREVESDEHNFTLLNLPPYHPARDSHDTFYTTRPDVVLRTHTSPAQVRAMRETGAPLRVVVPGATYRNDPPDASHNWQFYQMEGIAVGPNIHLTDLLGTITGFARLLFGAQIPLRFHSGYFPFTEPSLETFVQCTVCGGSGCKLCKGYGWVEVIPGGMIHPVVLRNGGLDPSEVSGFAFGAGVDRIAALWFRIPDIRMLLENDVRFLEQF
jgi:phenylalanyl-tRNA synthetase alpha chain